jgi:hypothetical protein
VIEASLTEYNRFRPCRSPKEESLPTTLPTHEPFYRQARLECLATLRVVGRLALFAQFSLFLSESGGRIRLPEPFSEQEGTIDRILSKEGRFFGMHR